jgi:DNA (cytosine-5)-methyltransferase 1
VTAATIDVELALKLAASLAPERRRYAVPVRRGPQLRLDRHVDSPEPTDLDSVRRWVRSARRPTAIDLFCGAGGLSLGLQDAGLTVLVGADSDPIAIESYAANLAGLTYRGDLTNPQDLLEHLSAWGISSVDLVAGGVPCQPFSRAGRSKIRSLVDARVRSPEDARTALWESFVKVVEALQPRAVLLENVPDLAEWEDGAVLVGFCEALRELRYDTDARILPAYQYGVPQHRSRLFIVGVRDGSGFDWPVPDSSSPTLWDAIGDLPEIPGGQRDERMSYSGPVTGLQRRLREKVVPSDRMWIYDHITRDVRPDDLEAFRILPEGGTYADVPKNLRRYRSDIFTDKYKRLTKDGLSRTITAHIARDGYWYIHPTQHRTLSVREAARVQTFPDWFRFAGEPSHRFRQVGNAVPPLLGQAVGSALLRALSKRRRTSPRSASGFRTDLLEWHRMNSRSYPWRAAGSPWMVLLAEMCLHRTRADQVNSIFAELLAIAGSPAELIGNQAHGRDLLASLGLRWRADNIVRVAEVILELFDGMVPTTREALLTLPGVGDYVANAVICFGFGRSSILMDTNTERIVSRVAGHDRAGRRWQLRLDLYKLAGAVGADPAFNYGLLDLGALVCKHSSPLCLSCPVARHCATFHSQRSKRGT